MIRANDSLHLRSAIRNELFFANGALRHCKRKRFHYLYLCGRRGSSRLYSRGISSKKERYMRRRDFVKAMVAASVSARSMLGQNAPASVTPSTPPPIPPKAAPLPAPGPVPWMRGLLDAKPLPMTPLVPDAVAHTQTRFFTRQQFATLRQLCEVLMPPLKGAPGAIDAGTPEFLDFLI